MPASTGYKVGDTARDFSLKNVDGKMVSLSGIKDVKGYIVVFTCNACPYAKAYEDRIIALNKKYATLGYPVVAINANDKDVQPADSYDNMQKRAKEKNYGFPYLYDETQKVAQAYHAACTPDFFLFDGEQRLVYRGQMDDSRPGNGIPVTGKDLRAAIDAVLANRPVSKDQRPSIGCNIKWRTGNEPTYFAKK